MLLGFFGVLVAFLGGFYSKLNALTKELKNYASIIIISYCKLLSNNFFKVHCYVMSKLQVTRKVKFIERFYKMRFISYTKNFVSQVTIIYKNHKCIIKRGI